MLKTPELTALLEDFYTLTGMRIVLFDEHFRELCAFPSGEDTLCTCLRRNEAFLQKCRESDAASFAVVKKTHTVHIYKCHAGLIEATVSVMQNQRTVGYLMFGQITDEKDRGRLAGMTERLFADWGIEPPPEGKMPRVKYKSEKQVQAAAKILEACAEYVILKNMIRESTPLIGNIEQYINEHLGEELDAYRICRRFGVSRTALYQLLRPYYDGGISDYIKQKRLARARELIETTDLSICTIADRVGFSDYNYFLRCFKKKYGCSSRHFRGKG